MSQHHKQLSTAQTCVCCGGTVNLHGDFITKWNGHQNIFFHQSCFKAMMDGTATGSLGEQIAVQTEMQL